MYILLSCSLIASAISWYLTMQRLWFLSLGVSVIILTCIDVSGFKSDLFLQKAIHSMQETECCCIHRVWSDPRSILWTMVVFRTMTGVIAAVAFYVTFIYSSSFATGHYFIITAIWTMVNIVWAISNVPFLICLVQCAAKTTSVTMEPIIIGGERLEPGRTLEIGDLKISMVSSDELIVRFRKVVSIWMLHDIVLGIFWLYLSLMMYDLTDDEDDSEWRTIFLSMLSWHIIFIVLYHIYLKRQWSCITIKSPPNIQSPCCGPAEADKWWAICQLGGLAAVYAAFIWRMRLPELTAMGCSEETLVLFICGVVACCIGKIMTRGTLQGRQLPTSKKLPVSTSFPKEINSQLMF
mgnify:CR=1 FL=1